jgi:hypothetical protein
MTAYAPPLDTTLLGNGEAVDYLTYLGRPMSIHTWKSYGSRGRRPAPDGYVGRSPCWLAPTLRAWVAACPGSGNWPRGESRSRGSARTRQAPA